MKLGQREAQLRCRKIVRKDILLWNIKTNRPGTWIGEPLADTGCLSSPFKGSVYETILSKSCYFISTESVFHSL